MDRSSRFVRLSVRRGRVVIPSWVLSRSRTCPPQAWTRQAPGAARAAKRSCWGGRAVVLVSAVLTVVPDLHWIGTG